MRFQSIIGLDNIVHDETTSSKWFTVEPCVPYLHPKLMPPTCASEGHNDKSVVFCNGYVAGYVMDLGFIVVVDGLLK